MLIPRDYQLRALDAARAEFRSGRRSVLLVAPTGSGKTVIFSLIAKGAIARGGRVLVIVHRRELIGQTVAKMAAAGIERVGVIASGFEADADAPVQVASVQTMLAREALPPATLLILDECHHYVAEQWGTIANHYASARIVGVTATPERGDGSPLGDLFESMVVVASIPELVAEGYLVPCDVIAPRRKTRTLCTDPVLAWGAHAGERPGVIFCGSVDDAYSLSERLNAAGIPAATVEGNMSSEHRDEALAKFERGELRALCNVFVLTEGWDCPRAEVCMIARGCSAAGTYLQMVGRVLRPSPGKTSARLIDLRGVVHEHGLPDEERTFSLEGRAISGGEAPLKTCPECGVTVPIATRVCPCGYVFPEASCEPDHAPLSKIEQAEIERAFFAEHLATAAERGFRPGWVAHRFQERFGRFPSKLWRAAFPKKGVAA